MAASHGKSQTLVYGGNTFTPYITGGGVSFSRETDMDETTAAGDDSRTYLKGMNGATMSVELLMDSVLIGYLETAYADTTAAGLAATFKPDGTRTYTFNAQLNNLNYDAPIGLNSISIDLQITGDVSYAAS